MSVNQLSLEEGSMNYLIKTDLNSVKNDMKRYSQCRDAQLMKGIICLVMILSIVSIGFIVLFKVPCHRHVPNVRSANAFVELPIRMDNIKDDGPSVDTHSILWKGNKRSMAKDDESTNVLRSQSNTEPITDASDQPVRTKTPTTPSFREMNDSEIDKLLLMWHDVLKIIKISIPDEEVSEGLDTSSRFADFSPMEPFHDSFSDIDSRQAFYDPYLFRFWRSLGNPTDVWGFDNESWDNIVNTADKCMPASGFVKRTLAEMISVTIDNDSKFSSDSRNKTSEETLLTSTGYRENRTGHFFQSWPLFSTGMKPLKNDTDARNHRNNPENLDLVVENWEINWNATCGRLDKFATQVVNGDTSEPMIVKLREKFVEMVKMLAWHVPLKQSNHMSSWNGSVNTTAEDWHICMEKLKREIRNLADVDHRRELERNDLSTQKMVNELRSIVEYLNRHYLSWVKIAIKLILVRKSNIDIKAIELECKKCAKSWNASFERLNILAVNVFGGESTVPSVVEVRRKFVKTVISLAWRMNLVHSHISERDWNTFTLKIRKEIATFMDSDLRKDFGTRESTMRRMVNELYDIVEHFSRDYMSCTSILTIYKYVGKLKENCLQAFQGNINSVSTTEHMDDFTTECYMLDKVLSDERRARFEASKSSELTQKQKTFWDAIPSAWNATSLSEIPLDDSILDNMLVLTMMKQIVANASLELQKEGYALLHDLFLEEQQLQNESEERMDWICALGNFTDNVSHAKYTPAMALNLFVIFGKGFNLHYQKIEIENSKDESTKSLFGKFVYLGEKPEKLNIRHVRHILNGIVRLYFKIQNPSLMKTMCGNPKLENKTKEESIKRPVHWYPASILQPSTSKKKRSSVWKSKYSMDRANAITSSQDQREKQRLHPQLVSTDHESSFENFYDKMETLSSHIDRLHERYMRFNELNDDYVSREFSVESELTDDNPV